MKICHMSGTAKNVNGIIIVDSLVPNTSRNCGCRTKTIQVTNFSRLIIDTIFLFCGINWWIRFLKFINYYIRKHKNLSLDKTDSSSQLLIVKMYFTNGCDLFNKYGNKQLENWVLQVLIRLSSHVWVTTTLIPFRCFK